MTADEGFVERAGFAIRFAPGKWFQSGQVFPRPVDFAEATTFVHLAAARSVRTALIRSKRHPAGEPPVIVHVTRRAGEPVPDQEPVEAILTRPTSQEKEALADANRAAKAAAAKVAELRARRQR